MFDAQVCSGRLEATAARDRRPGGRYSSHTTHQSGKNTSLKPSDVISRLIYSYNTRSSEVIDNTRVLRAWLYMNVCESSLNLIMTA